MSIDANKELVRKHIDFAWKAATFDRLDEVWANECVVHLAEAAGTPILWQPDEARMMVAALGTPEFGWASFQPLFDEIVDAEPELRN